MVVTVRLTGWLRHFVPDGEASATFPDGTTCAGALEMLGVPVGPCLWVRNGERVGYDAVLHDGDRLVVSMMAAGG